MNIKTKFSLGETVVKVTTGGLVWITGINIRVIRDDRTGEDAIGIWYRTHTVAEDAPTLREEWHEQWLLTLNEAETWVKTETGALVPF